MIESVAQLMEFDEDGPVTKKVTETNNTHACPQDSER